MAYVCKQKLQCLVPRSFYPTIYKTFVRPHLDYVSIICEKVFDSSFYEIMESVYATGTAN